MLRTIFSGITLVAVGGIMLACDSKDPNASDTVGPAAAPKKEAKQEEPKPVIPVPDRHLVFKEPKVQKGDKAVIETNLGTIEFTFFNDLAPKHVANFEKLADAGFYDGIAFHRVKPGFMIQGGDPNTLGSDVSLYGAGGPGWNVPAEFSKAKFERGIVGMARSPDPNSAGSQFYIMVAPAPFLNGQYTVFGKVTKGMDVVDKIVQVPNVGDAGNNRVEDINSARMKSVKIVHPGGK